MATVVPAPTIDGRNGDLLAAQAIGALPSELSDRSNSNPIVVLIEAVFARVDALMFQLNQWPSAVIQKVLNLVGITLIPATGSTVQQSFTLSAPQSRDVIIPSGTLFGTSDGTIVFSTAANLTITALISPAGTATLTTGSVSVSGSGFSNLQVGWQISTDQSTWYTILAIASDIALTLTSASTSTVAGSAYFSGAVTGTVSALSTTTGLATRVAAGTLTSLQSQPAGVASTTNPAAASGGADQETIAQVIARAPQALAAGGIATTASDYAYFAQQVLGTNGRAAAQANTNDTAATNGYTTVASLSPVWTTSTALSTQEQANIARDQTGRTYAGATTVNVAANIQQYVTAGNGSTPGTMFACAVYRKSAYDEASTQVAASGAANTYLSPNTYPWGRSIDPSDLVGQLEALTQVDHVASINGRVAVGMDYTVVANNVTFTNGSTSATGTAGDFTNMTAGQTFLMDSTNKAVYLVTTIASGTLTITPAYAGPTAAFKPGWFTSKITTLTKWYSLPLSLLSVLTSAPPASILVVGAV